MKKINFSAGPSILPDSVFERASFAMLDFENTGLSIAEISHRSKDFMSVIENAESLVRELLNVSQDYAVLFLQAGASLQFYMAPLNLLPESGFAQYTDTGVWASKAINEAKKVGKIDVIASSKDDNYSYIPKNYDIDSKATYFHCTSNNTIFGTQMKDFPNTSVPIVCDMSSDIFSREIDVNKFGLIYAGAQKNIGPAGSTLVIVRKDLLGKTGRDLPSMLDYDLHIKNQSMYNTPCTISIYMSMLNLLELKKRGGVKEAEKYNKEKAEMLYKEIDENPLFKANVKKEDRSLMNVTFTLADDRNAELFADICRQNNISGLAGHRLAGGYRASIYNAMTKDKISVLILAMRELRKRLEV